MSRAIRRLVKLLAVRLISVLLRAPHQRLLLCCDGKRLGVKAGNDRVFFLAVFFDLCLRIGCQLVVKHVRGLKLTAVVLRLPDYKFKPV